MKNFLLIFFAGGLGSCFRYAISLFFNKQHSWPYATFMVNLLGCFFIGYLYSFFQKHDNPSLKILLVTGFCGGFTTFSAFSLENFHYIQQNQYITAILYSLSSVVLGIISLYIGYRTSILC
jgi:fluoride exporter